MTPSVISQIRIERARARSNEKPRGLRTWAPLGVRPRAAPTSAANLDFSKICGVCEFVVRDLGKC